MHSCLAQLYMISQNAIKHIGVVCPVVSQHIRQFCNEQKEDLPWLWNFKKNKSISSGTCFLYSRNSLQTLNSRRPFWKINELHFQPQFISCQYLSWAAGEGGRVLSKETPSCLSPLPISHQASLSPTQSISQSVHTHRVQAQGNEECTEGRKDKMKKGEVNKGNNVAAACPGGFRSHACFPLFFYASRAALLVNQEIILCSYTEGKSGRT